MCAACSRPPQLVPSVRQMGTQEFVRQASDIVIAQVTSIRATKHLAAEPDERKSLDRLVQADVVVENVLKGDVQGKDLTFYYYFPAYGFSLPSVNLLGPGERVIFFLKRDQNVYRSVNDVYASCIHLVTGSHPGLSTGPDKPVEQAIAEACLLPGSKRDLDRQHWPYEIAHAARVAGHLIGPRKTIDLLNTLRSYPDYRVRTAACLAAAEAVPVKDPCNGLLKTDTFLETDFDWYARQEAFRLQQRYDLEHGVRVSPIWPPRPPPRVPVVSFEMK